MMTEEIKNTADNWKAALLGMPIFQHLPPIKQILMHFESVDFKKGEVIISQGSEGDYYYIIKNGECSCTRKASPNAKEIVLRKLVTGDTFGEDALITGAPRDLTITALTDISLMRLSKHYFVTLIKDPALTFVDFIDMQTAKSQGTLLLDVRTPEAYNKQHIEDSINMPFFALRIQIKTLNPKSSYIIICDDGKIGEAAAFLLLKHNFEVAVLKGGILSTPCMAAAV